MKTGYIDQYDKVPLKGKNIGDYVQTLAALQFLSDNPIPVNRERLDEYVGDEIKIIMASWMMSHPEHFPPSNKIIPLFVSTHFTEKSLNNILTQKKCYDYFKKFEPIGCRDTATVALFEKYGIKAYFSACLTLTLGETYSHISDGDEILMVDVMYNYRTIKELFIDLISVPREILSQIKNQGIYNTIKHKINDVGKRRRMLNKLFTNDFINHATFITQLVRHKKTDDYLSITDQYLKRLSKAKLVVTSRIHCALPCLAMGTPVIFIDSDLDQARISGLKDLFNKIEIKDNEIKINFKINGKIDLSSHFDNPKKYLIYKDNLIKKIEDFFKD